jgi:hypothetical protein
MQWRPHLADFEEAARRAQGLDAEALVLPRQGIENLGTSRIHVGPCRRKELKLRLIHRCVLAYAL